VVWDVKNGVMLRDARFTTKDVWETFPAWSPDGKWLYYCAADKKNMPFDSQKLMYALCRVDFDAITGRFGNCIDTIATAGKSVSFPRLSPDGRYLLYTASAYATFPVWHREASLEMIDLYDGSTVDIQAVNSNEADSYHAWSSNGRWIVFSSRRIDGLYTRTFFAYFDSTGRIHKPFLLPQKKPDHDALLLKSYNVPEFVKGKIQLSPYEISRNLGGTIINLKEFRIESPDYQ
jgi:Tol biopolymer transport system component